MNNHGNATMGKVIATLILLGTCTAVRAEFAIQQIADPDFLNRDPVISETGIVAWHGMRLQGAGQRSHVFAHRDGELDILTLNTPTWGNSSLHINGDRITWVSYLHERGEGRTQDLADPVFDDDDQILDGRWVVAAESGDAPHEQRLIAMGDPDRAIGDHPLGGRTSPRRGTGDAEIMLWNGDQITRLTVNNLDDQGPVVDEGLVAWQVGRGWPFGWEIMAWANGTYLQLTTNFYYDMGPQISGNQVVWYGWDGQYNQVFLYDHEAEEITQLTDTSYNNTGPRISNGVVFWEGLPDAGSDIFMWRDGEITRLTNNPDDDRNIRTWNGQAVWESFDGSFFQIYHFDGGEVHQLTNTRYDNMQPDIGEGVITWMGYVDNFDAEIFAWTGGPDPIRLTENDYEDRRPRTAGGRIVWQADDEDASYIFLAEPR